MHFPSRSFASIARAPIAAVILAGLVLAGCDQSMQSPASQSQQIETAPQSEAPAVRKTAQGRVIPSDTIQYGLPGSAIRRAVTAQEKHAAALANLPGVKSTASSLDENGDPVIVLRVNGDPSTYRKRLPAEVGGVSVQVKKHHQMMLNVDLTGEPGRGDPLPTGFSIGHFATGAGTYGACVERPGQPTSVLQDEFILSNNHVLANRNNASLGDAIYQPGPADGGTSTDQVAGLTDFVPLSTTADYSVNSVDAAIAKRGGANIVATTASSGYGRRSPITRSAYVGMPIQKYGRTTELTRGTVVEVNVTDTVGVDLDNDRIADVLYPFQYGILTSANFSEPGDSGSLVVTDDAERNPVGLLFAGTSQGTLLNPIDLVTSALGVTMDLHPNPDIQGPGVIEPYGTDPFSVRDLPYRCTDGGPYSYEWSVQYGTNSTWYAVGGDSPNVDLWTPPVGTLTLRVKMTDRNGSTATAEKFVIVYDGS